MARRRVTYVESGAPAAGAARTEVALGPPASPEAPIPERGHRRIPRWAAAAAVVALALAWVLRPTPDPARPPEREPAPLGRSGQPVDPGEHALDVRDVLPPPWRGELVREPDARGARPVPRIHLLSAADPDGPARVLAVVDATRRAFPGAPRAAGPTERPVRVIGDAEGTGLRTWQWDEAGYGISLTTVGLTPVEQRRVAIAVDVPGGRSLVSGRLAAWEEDVLARAGLVPVEVRSGAASVSGGPAIGQPGGASIGGYLADGAGRRRLGGRTVRLDVTHAPVLSASRVVRALGRSVLSDADVATSALLVAVLDHPGESGGDERQGWDRVLVDLPGSVTATLSSTTVGAAELLDLAASVNLERLAAATTDG